MSTISTTIVAIAYRNFNLCPHRVFQGEQGLLRLCEGIPMISRSDGQLFHLLLADRPMPYPAETESGPTTQISVCFWYSHTQNAPGNGSTVVILRKPAAKRSTLFREIDDVADCLAELLAGSRRIASMYEFANGPLTEVGQ